MTDELVETREPDFHWAGRPVYRCRECGDRYERVGDLAAVLSHESTAHAPLPRVSDVLVGQDGEPLVVS